MSMKSDWVPSSVVCKELGISFKHLTRLREEGLFKPRRHYRDVSRPRANRPTYRYHLEKCKLAIEKVGKE